MISKKPPETVVLRPAMLGVLLGDTETPGVLVCCKETEELPV